MSIERIEVSKRLSEAVVHHETVYLCGQVADDLKGDIASQTREVLANIDTMLARAGSDKSKLLSATVYLKSIGDYAAMNALWDAWTAPGTRRALPARYPTAIPAASSVVRARGPRNPPTSSTVRNRVNGARSAAVSVGMSKRPSSPSHRGASWR